MPKKGKQVIKSHVADKNLAHKCTQLIEQAKRIASPREKYGEFREVQLYNSMVTGMHNYYQLATLVAADFRKVNRAVMTVLTNRLRGQKESRLAKHGRELTKYEKERYGESGCLRFDRNTNEPIYPAGYVRHKIPLLFKKIVLVCRMSSKLFICYKVFVFRTLRLPLPITSGTIHDDGFAVAVKHHHGFLLG